MSSSHRPADPHALRALEARLAGRFAALLVEASEQTPRDIGERLRVAREQALQRARHARRAAAPAAAAAAVTLGGRGAAVLGGGPGWWQRLAALAPLAVLVVGLLAVEQVAQYEQVQAAAEIDALLLADDLPPDAYSDPGFGEFLRSPKP